MCGFVMHFESTPPSSGVFGIDSTWRLFEEQALKEGAQHARDLNSGLKSFEASAPTTDLPRYVYIDWKWEVADKTIIPVCRKYAMRKDK